MGPLPRLMVVLAGIAMIAGGRSGPHDEYVDPWNPDYDRLQAFPGHARSFQIPFSGTELGVNNGDASNAM